MFHKFLSRKLIVSAVGFVTVTVLPNLPTATKARYAVAITAVYALAQGFADAFGSAKQGASQGSPPSK